jgi:integrase/recombinase XerD
MATVAIIYRTDKLNLNGLAPIHLRIIKDRKVNYITTGIMLPEKFWDEKNKKVKSGFPNSKRLNSFIANKYAELQDQVFEHETVSKSLTTRQLKEKIYGPKAVDFFSFADEVVQRYLKAGKIGTYDKIKSIIMKLKNYCESRPIVFQEITPHFLSKYEAHLRDFHHNASNTIHKDFKFIRQLFNEAYKLDLIDIGQNPFNRYKVKLEKTHRAFLTEEELERVEKLALTPGSRMALHRDMFVFASYSGGLRVSDVLQLQWKNFDGSHLNITIRKTGEHLALKLPQKSLEILEAYGSGKKSANEYIFKMLPADLNLNDPREIDNALGSGTAYINKNLKIIATKAAIEKPLSFHISRHTWATRALRKGISIDKVSKLMGHAAIKETQIYAKIVNEELDKAMEVFN